MSLVARREGNRVIVERCDYSSFTLCLDDEMMDLDKPVMVEYDGAVLFKGKVKRNKATMARNLRERKDVRFAFPAEIQVKVPSRK